MTREQIPLVEATWVHVTEGHYDTVGAALLWTLEQGLGSSFTPEVRAAWASAYGLVAGAMKAAARAKAA
jgi:hemoglobin-like flavoprotein